MLSSELFDACQVGELRLLPKFATFKWVPWHVHFRNNVGLRWWLLLGDRYHICQAGDTPEEGYHVAWSFCGVQFERPETEEEAEEREYAEEEARYLDWCADFYSY